MTYVHPHLETKLGSSTCSVFLAKIKCWRRFESHVMLQFSDAISIIGREDFPDKWPTLLPEMVEKFNSGDFHIINGVLRTAHSIFKRYELCSIIHTRFMCNMQQQWNDSDLYLVLIYSKARFKIAVFVYTDSGTAMSSSQTSCGQK